MPLHRHLTPVLLFFLHFLRLQGIILSLIVTVVSALSGQEPEKPVRLDFSVTVPTNTPADASVYIAGNLVELGRWQPDGLMLIHQAKGEYTACIRIPKGTRGEFKITQGTWERVEKAVDGSEIPNRTFLAEKDQQIHISVARWAEGKAPLPTSTMTGIIRVHLQFHSRFLENDRTLWVYLPPDYEQKPEKRYPVLYLQDGQNVFDSVTSFAGEWQADETAEKCIRSGQIAPLIIVAIANNKQRIREYTPPGAQPNSQSGLSDRYARMLLEEIKPFIDRNYRTLKDRNHTAVGGSSLGGLVALYIATQYPHQIGKVAALSPSLWWNNRWMIRSIEQNPEPLKECLLWIDIGSLEGSDAVKNVTILGDILGKTRPIENKQFIVKIFDGASHNEKSWANRLDEILQFLFPP